MSATPIEISVGGSRTATEWDGCSITWADFTDPRGVHGPVQGQAG